MYLKTTLNIVSKQEFITIVQAGKKIRVPVVVEAVSPPEIVISPDPVQLHQLKIFYAKLLIPLYHFKVHPIYGLVHQQKVLTVVDSSLMFIKLQVSIFLAQIQLVYLISHPM